MNTRTTPGTAAAAAVSMRTTSARAWSASRTAPCSMPVGRAGRRRTACRRARGRSPGSACRSSRCRRAGAPRASRPSRAARPRRGSSRSRCTGRGARRGAGPRCRGRARSPLRSSSAATRTRMPGVQNPHCSAPVAANADASRSRSLVGQTLERRDRRARDLLRPTGCSSRPPCRRRAPCNSRTGPTASSRLWASTRRAPRAAPRADADARPRPRPRSR